MVQPQLLSNQILPSSSFLSNSSKEEISIPDGFVLGDVSFDAEKVEEETSAENQEEDSEEEKDAIEDSEDEKENDQVETEDVEEKE